MLYRFYAVVVPCRWFYSHSHEWGLHFNAMSGESQCSAHDSFYCAQFPNIKRYVLGIELSKKD